MKMPSSPTFDDIRSVSHENRKEIGFKGRATWQDAPARFDEHALTIQGHPVMEDWEEQYMHALADIAAGNGGVILEVGFGMGISARYIQKHPIERHIIIEANRDVYERSVAFAKGAIHPVTPILGFWEEATALLAEGSIDGILFDTYPLSEKEIHTNHFPFFKEAFRLLAPGGTLTYYSDEIDDFSPLHRSLLKEAGFRYIEKYVCEVTPPNDCTYWKSPTIVAPIIRK